MRLIERDGYLEQIWQIEYSIHGFEYKLFIRGTEPEVHNYMDSEMGYMGGYSSCTDREIEAVKLLKLPIYIAPEL